MATIRAAQPVLELPDVLVVGSEVPNLLEPGAAATLVVSLDKGERDLLVALGLLTLADADDVDELDAAYRALPAELGHAVRSNLTLLSLLEPRAGMPDPRPRRADVAALLRRIEGPCGSEP